MSKISKSILIISDFHAPYNHPDAARFLEKVRDKYQPDRVVCIGDEVDYHAMSFHDHDPDLPSAGEELERAIKQLTKLYKIFPTVDVIESNHGSMVLRRALSSGMPKKVLREYNAILDAPEGWRWVFDLKIKTPMGEVYFCHGKSSSPGKLASQYGMSCVQGHYHEKAQITYISTPDKLMFDMHVGCLADDNSLALGYNKINPRRPIVSIGLIIDGVPRILPMILNKNGRWVGNV